jgi:hypothetical protein
MIITDETEKEKAVVDPFQEELKGLLTKWNGELKTIREHYGEDSVCRAIRKHIDELKSILKNFGAKINM